jgi:hypothetical protein
LSSSTHEQIDFFDHDELLKIHEASLVQFETDQWALKGFLLRHQCAEYFDKLVDYGVDTITFLVDPEIATAELFTSSHVGMSHATAHRLLQHILEFMHTGEGIARASISRWSAEAVHFESRALSQHIQQTAGQRIGRSISPTYTLANTDLRTAKDQVKAIRRAGLVRDNDYKGGEANVMRANYLAATLTWPQLCGLVTESGNTIFNFDMAVCQRLFDIIDEDCSGFLSLNEVVHVGEKRVVVDYIRRVNQPTLELLIHQDAGSSKAANILKRGVMISFLSAVDGNGDGCVDREEWNQFINNLRSCHLRYLKQCMLLKRHCYFGHGLEADEYFWNPGYLVSRGILLRGYLEDFWFYSKNNHPLLMIWFCDPENPFTPYERRVGFISTTAVTLLGAALLLLLDDKVVAFLTLHLTSIELLTLTRPQVILFGAFSLLTGSRLAN